MAQWLRDPCAMLRTSMSVSGTGFTWASFGITSTRRNFSKMPDAYRVLEICGEGRTDIGNVVSPTESRTEPQPPAEGVVPVLLHKLCGEPATMRVVRRAVPHLQGKGLWQRSNSPNRQPFTIDPLVRFSSWTRRGTIATAWRSCPEDAMRPIVSSRWRLESHTPVSRPGCWLTLWRSRELWDCRTRLWSRRIPRICPPHKRTGP